MAWVDRESGSVRIHVGLPLLLNGRNCDCGVTGKLLSRLIRVFLPRVFQRNFSKRSEACFHGDANVSTRWTGGIDKVSASHEVDLTHGHSPRTAEGKTGSKDCERPGRYMMAEMGRWIYVYTDS